MSLRISCRIQDEWISADETDWSERERERAEGWLAKGERGRNGQTTTSGPGTSKVRVLEGNGARWKNCLDVKTWESLLRRPHSIKRPRPKRYAIRRAAYIYVEEALAQTHGRAAYTERKIYTTTQARHRPLGRFLLQHGGGNRSTREERTHEKPTGKREGSSSIHIQSSGQLSKPPTRYQSVPPPPPPGDRLHRPIIKNIRDLFGLTRTQPSGT